MEYAMNRNKGFTLVELMVVIAILSILLVVAISAYTDYVVRSKVGEGMVFAGEAKTGVSEYFYNIREWPPNNQAAGLPLASSYNRYDWIEKLEITNTPKPGSISITIKIPGTTANGKELHLVPSTPGEIINWTCTSPDDDKHLEINHRPANCRS
jgi:type IV pilus assembly protein PilA